MFFKVGKRNVDITLIRGGERYVFKDLRVQRLGQQLDTQCIALDYIRVFYRQLEIFIARRTISGCTRPLLD